MESDLRRFCLTVGKQVRRLRLERHLTQEDMAERGFVVRHYQRIEAGECVTLANIWKLARAFEVPVRLILPEADPPERIRLRQRRGPIRKALRVACQTQGRPNT
jgi:transcriptional regulator with XRE-family HTH domain